MHAWCLVDEAPAARARGSGEGAAGRAHVSDNRVLWCFFPSPPANANSSRVRSLVAPLHTLATSCALALARSLSQRPCLGARVGVDSARRPGLFGSLSGATPRVVACLAGACQRALCLAWSGNDCLMPVPSNRRRSRVRRELEVAASDESSLKLFKVSPVIDISDSKFSVWLSKPRSHRLLYLA